jgi:hypothetical protein
MEHRWGERRPSNKPVYLRCRSGLAAKGCVRDVSISGAFVVTPLPAPLFSYVCVYFHGPYGMRHVNSAAEGQVVRRLHEGLGIEWCEFAPQAVRALMAPELPAPARAVAER